MLKEFIDRIAELGVKAASPKKVDVPGGPDHVSHFIGPDGGMVEVVAKPECRDHKAFDIPTLAEFLEQKNAVTEGNQAVWYSREGIVCLLNDDDRRDKVTIDLNFSPQMEALQSRCVAMSQKAFVRFLRVDLAGVDGVGPLLTAVREVRFKSDQSSAGSIVHGKESIGKSLGAEMENNRVPELVSLLVPVFDGFITHQPFAVACAVEIDPAAATFALTPMPGSIEGAIRSAEAFIGGMLSAALPVAVPVYYGNP